MACPSRALAILRNVREGEKDHPDFRDVQSGGILWKASLVLLHYMERKVELRGKRVLELSAGGSRVFCILCMCMLAHVCVCVLYCACLCVCVCVCVCARERARACVQSLFCFCSRARDRCQRSFLSDISWKEIVNPLQ
jgi:hypothetical protein